MIDRRAFLAGTAAAAVPPSPAPAPSGLDPATLGIVTAASNRQVAAVLAAPLPARPPRATLRQMRRLATAYAWRRSAYYHDAALLPPIEQLLASVEARQHEDGTFSAGNRHSPPDTAFLMEDMATMIAILRRDGQAAGMDLAARLAAMMRKAGPALATGGIHTPNHRWELSAALARIDEVAGEQAYRTRIDDWLGEGIDVDGDGIYSERSPIYASEVTNSSLLVLARLIGRADLRAIVRRNLHTTIALAEPRGLEVETVLSRRQDQDQRRQTLRSFYLQYREMALTDGNRRFAGVVRTVERLQGGELGDALADLIERPEIARPLPAAAEPFVDLLRHYVPTGLVRQRRGPLTASFYAGSDWYVDGRPSPFFNRIGSGLATNPTLMRVWRGALVLEAVRLIPDFFAMGHFRPSAIALAPKGTVRMNGAMRVPYYQPLPADRRRADGAYPMSDSIDGRFNSALDFEHRPASFRTLEITIVAVPRRDGFDLRFETAGERDVDMAIELTLRPGGSLQGARRREDGSFHLTEGQATYQVGADRLVVGPGNGDGPVRADAGDLYAWAGGKLQLPGTRLYITGRTPLRYDLSLTFA